MKAWIASSGVVEQVVVVTLPTLPQPMAPAMVNPRLGPLTLNSPLLTRSFLRCARWTMWSTLYCITAALDRYVTLLDRTPCTQTMTSQCICSKDFCDPWYTHPKKYYPLCAHLPSVCPFTLCLPIYPLFAHLLLYGLFPSRLLPSKPPTADKVCPWLSSTDFTTSAQPVALITVERTWKIQWKRQTIGS